MTACPIWGDAKVAAANLTPAQRRLLLLVARLPLVFADVLEAVEGLRGRSSLYRTLNRLRRAGLLRCVRSAFGSADDRGYWHVTELGLAVVAIDQNVDIALLAREVPATEARLATLVAELPYLAVQYCLLADLAAAGPGQPELLAWERPWRRTYWPLRAKTPQRVRLPAYAALRWDTQSASFILLYDDGALPVRAARASLNAFVDWRDATGAAAPNLLVWTASHERSDAWRGLLEDVGQRGSGQPLAHILLAPRQDHIRLDVLVPGLPPGAAPAPLFHRAAVRPLQERRDSSRLVVPSPARGRARDLKATRPVLRLSRLRRDVLDVVAEHPLLTRSQIATLVSLSEWGSRRLPNELIRAGFLRRIGADELGTDAGPELFELTRSGLQVTALQHGLTLATATRLKGYVGGGPRDPVGRRRNLVRHLDHTLGVNYVFTCLRGSGGSSELTEWQNPKQCCRWPVRPDGYGIYRVDGMSHGFFLEFDRGTMSHRDYLAKLNAYYDFRDGERVDRYYDGFPTILFVTTDNTAEKRFARAARAAAIGRGAPLPVLLTTLWRLSAVRDVGGYLGRVWRKPDHDFHRRDCWPARSWGRESIVTNSGRAN